MREIPLTPYQIELLGDAVNWPMICAVDNDGNLIARPVFYSCAESIFCTRLDDDKKKLIEAITL